MFTLVYLVPNLLLSRIIIIYIIIIIYLIIIIIITTTIIIVLRVFQIYSKTVKELIYFKESDLRNKAPKFATCFLQMIASCF